MPRRYPLSRPPRRPHNKRLSPTCVVHVAMTNAGLIPALVSADRTSGDVGLTWHGGDPSATPVARGLRARVAVSSMASGSPRQPHVCATFAVSRVLDGRDISPEASARRQRA